MYDAPGFGGKSGYGWSSHGDDYGNKGGRGGYQGGVRERALGQKLLTPLKFSNVSNTSQTPRLFSAGIFKYVFLSQGCHAVKDSIFFVRFHQ